MLHKIVSGLNFIHKQNLIHCDFHDGNILNHNESNIYVSDLGLCQPVKSFLKEYKIYGVVPFMAPEVLRGKPYTPASDVYSFSMIMWEFTSGIPPFNNRAHDIQLSLSICKGERPEIIENTPQCYVDLMKKCWDENLLNRPSSKEVLEIIKKWIY
ncbi:kinase-like domain-containing protein [Rhizophagus irregularis DAOM 181602=DAOM 197198]|nr:kinase-like domain-containing protein [Rhizophagus irregularis DAOM 181602=DAOM 197198]POG61950.1 kinase-like domain-containing protein [Rhizophagus irregularis DAOM 181602=DAOM 197198]|eukprot:XP_025168816.1 kinase-like domain-containing protein [Rhizophagus irregularis DAOM 181602=DAOM 197198]